MTRNTGAVYTVSPDPRVIQARENELQRWKGDCHGITSDVIMNDLVRKAARWAGKPETDNWLDFAMQFQEDVAMLYRGNLAAVAVFFPSGWIPRRKLGKSLTEIHEPVADSEHLTKVSDRLAKTISDPVLGSFCRSVWTLTSLGTLNNHPHIPRPPAQNIKDLYFRSEYQTTAPLGDGETSLFFIDVKVQPLFSIWDDPDRRKIIIESVNSMSENVLKYKNLQHIKHIINSR
jgi:hypothetical protein